MSANFSARWAKLALVAVGALALVGGSVSTSYAANDAKTTSFRACLGEILTSRWMVKRWPAG